MWRWFSINIGDDVHFGGIRIGTEAGDLHRGWVWKDGEHASIAEWRVRGIRVIAFRPPIGEAIRAIEDEHSGYDENEIRKQVVEHGGEWLEFDSSAYRYYDGHHLHFTAAPGFSRDLAEKILASTPPPAPSAPARVD